MNIPVALILQFALQYGIPAAREIILLMHKPAPTLDDWNRLFDMAEANARSFLAATDPNKKP